MRLVLAATALLLSASCLPAAGIEAPQPLLPSLPAVSPSVETPLPVPRPRDLAEVAEEVTAPSAPPAAATAPPPPPPRAKGVPDDYKLAMLIRTSLLALNQANLTGNYSVLRDLGAPAFQQANNPARLGQLFANLRMRQINLDPVLVIEPKIAEPFINDRGMLRLKGFFPTKPERVNFELAFQKIDEQWRLFAIAVTTSLVGPLAKN